MGRNTLSRCGKMSVLLSQRICSLSKAYNAPSQPIVTGLSSLLSDPTDSSAMSRNPSKQLVFPEEMRSPISTHSILAILGRSILCSLHF